MAQARTIVVHLERLKMYDQSSSSLLAFGATLLVGADAVDASDEFFLQPWQWGAIEKFLCVFLDSAGKVIRKPAATPGGPVGPPIVSESRLLGGPLPTFSDPDRTALFDALAFELTNGGSVQDALKVPERFVMQFGDVLHTFDPDNPAPKPWQAVVGQMALTPYPVAQWLKLSHQFLLPMPPELDLTQAVYVLAAPVLNAAKEVEKFPADILAPGREGADLDAASASDPLMERKWRYMNKDGSAASPALNAVIRPCGKTPGEGIANERFIDFNTLWISSPTSFASDWRTSIEPKLALAMDLCQRIIEYIRPFDESSASATSLPTAADLPLLTDMALASLRDQIGLGLRPGPDGERLLNKCLRLADSESRPTLTDPLVAILIQFLPTQFPDITAWKAFLNGLGVSRVIPELAKLRILTEVPQDRKDAGSQLQTLHTLLLGGDGTNLAKVFVAQWRDLLAKPSFPRPAVLTDQRLGAIQNLADRLQFRPQLSLHLLGAFWGDYVRGAVDANSADLIATKFPNLLASYFNRRFGISGPAIELYPPMRIADASRVKALQDYVTKWAKGYVSVLQPASLDSESKSVAAGTGGPDLATTVPHNLSVQVGRLAGLPADRANRDDVLSHLSGIGVLMRRQSKPESLWRCLNLAQAKVNRPGKRDGYTIRRGQPLLVPTRLTYVNDLRQMLLTYSNQPLAAESPLTQPAMTNGQLDGQQKNLPDPVMRYPYSSAEAALTPGLRFGESYEFAFFAVSNSGAFPNRIGLKLGNTWSPVAFPDLSKSQPVVPSKGVTVAVSYKRRVPIGQMRVFNIGEGGLAHPKNLALPVIPDNVHPRARELPGVDGGTDAPLLVMPSPQMRSYNQNLPGQFDFEFRMPSTDRETWLRWVFQPSDDPAVRAPAAEYEGQFIEDFYRVADGGNTSANSRLNLSIDDPALLRGNKSGTFMARLEVLGATDKWTRARGDDGKQLEDVWISAEPDVFPVVGLGAFQRESIRVSCKADDSLVLKKTADPLGKGLEALEMHGKQGEIYRLSIYNCVGQDDFKRFEISVGQDGKITSPIVQYEGAGTVKIEGTGTSVYLVSPFRLVIEIATAALIPDATQAGTPAALELDADRTANDLYGCIVTSKFDPRATRVQLDATQGTSAKFRDFRYLYRMDLLRQVWRWQGRPAAPHPELEAPGPNDPATAAQWEAVEFGEIRETDYIIYPMLPTGSGTTKGFRYSEQLGGPVAQGDRRGLVFRFAVRAYSRYEGWLPSSLASVLAAAPVGVENPGTVWTSYFVPPRPQMPLPAPKVRLIFPLTEGYEGSSAGSPGLLVVLDEPWYERGGLGEKLLGEVQVSADPRLSPDQNKTFYYETGPDPLFTKSSRALSPQTAADPAADGIAQADVDFGASAAFPAKTILGPTGHTLEISNAAPLYVASSFILPAPKIQTANGIKTDLRGYFCKLRLQRTVRLGLNGETVSSDFTEPYWVQYLPEFSMYDSLREPVTRMRVQLGDKAKDAELVDSQGAVATLQPFAAGTRTHALYLVITRHVFDVTGRPDQEVFLGLYRQAGSKWITDESAFDAGLGTDASGPIRARVVEVQVPTGVAPPAAKASDFWSALFPDPVADLTKVDPAKARSVESQARIVRISRPINSSTPAGVCAEE